MNMERHTQSTAVRVRKKKSHTFGGKIKISDYLTDYLSRKIMSFRPGVSVDLYFSRLSFQAQWTIIFSSKISFCPVGRLPFSAVLQGFSDGGSTALSAHKPGSGFSFLSQLMGKMPACFPTPPVGVEGIPTLHENH